MFIQKLFVPLQTKCAYTGQENDLVQTSWQESLPLYWRSNSKTHKGLHDGTTDHWERVQKIFVPRKIVKKVQRVYPRGRSEAI